VKFVLLTSKELRADVTRRPPAAAAVQSVNEHMLISSIRDGSSAGSVDPTVKEERSTVESSFALQRANVAPSTFVVVDGRLTNAPLPEFAAQLVNRFVVMRTVLTLSTNNAPPQPLPVELRSECDAHDVNSQFATASDDASANRDIFERSREIAPPFPLTASVCFQSHDTNL
jgi:hypothetical protein